MYDKMRPNANQPAKSFATAKTLKFNKIEDINAEELKFRPINLNVFQKCCEIYLL